MLRSRPLVSIVAAALLAGCSSTGGGPSDHGAPPPGTTPPGGGEDGGLTPPSGDGGASSGHDGGSADSGKTPAPDAGSGGDGGGCYSEAYDPSVSLVDLSSAYTSADWLMPSLTTMMRRYPTGYFVLDAEQNDPQLSGFADPSSWSALMESLMTMVHEESHGWDFDHAQGTGHPYVLTDALQIDVPQLTTWPRSDITQYITDDSTQQYDQTYLQGEQGTYDAVFLFEELNAYNNGLAAITAVGDQMLQQISARDGVAAHLYYLELYLRAGRTQHASDYAALQADPSWMKLLRYEWARGHYWDAQAKPNPTLDIASAPIWTHIVDPTNLAEIQMFTGQPPDQVACHP